MQPTVSVCIANYNQDHLIDQLISSINMQDYNYIQICIYDDDEGIGSGEAFNRAIELAKGDIVVLMCADDVFTDKHVISDIVKQFETIEIGHVSRYYYQFLDGKDYPVRAWHKPDIIELANNPSGLAFRRSALQGNKLTNKMFVEAPTLVADVLADGWDYRILPYDTVAVRIHASTARSEEYYRDMWVSSPVEEWVSIGGRTLLKDFTSLIQIKNYFTTKAVWIEIMNYVKLRPLNLLHPGLWFFGVVSLSLPRCILWHVPHWYRVTLGRWTTRVIKREA